MKKKLIIDKVFDYLCYTDAGDLGFDIATINIEGEGRDAIYVEDEDGSKTLLLAVDLNTKGNN